MKKIPYVNLSAQWQSEKNQLLKIIKRIMESGQYVEGEEIIKFEKNLSKFCGTKYCVALNSGTDALICGLLSLGVKKGDEVITPPNSFIASTAAIVHIGAIPRFVDVMDDQNIDPKKIEKSINSKTTAIMSVHLTGRMSKMKEIYNISKKYKIPVIEDAAQAIGSSYKKIKSGNWGDVGCFSTHPLKNLNACGDGGFIVTNKKKIHDLIKSIRNHGMLNRNKVERFGSVSRMDNLQAAILNFRLNNLKKIISMRQKNVKLYKENLDLKNIYLPKDEPEQFNTFHTFVIQVSNRDQLKKFLEKKGIYTSIHYPIPIHLQPASQKFKYKLGDFPKTEEQAKKIITLPINQFVSKKEILYICKMINYFYNR